MIQKLIPESFARGRDSGWRSRTHPSFLTCAGHHNFRDITDAAKVGDMAGSNWGDVAPSSFWINLSYIRTVKVSVQSLGIL